MKIKYILPLFIALFSLAVLLGWVALQKKSTPSHYVENRYDIIDLSMQWIQVSSPGSGPCIEFSKAESPSVYQDLGIQLRLSVEFVSDSSKVRPNTFGHLIKGFDGAKDSILAINLVFRDSLGQTNGLSDIGLFRDIGMPCYKEISNSPDNEPEQNGYVSDEHSTITDFGQLQSRLNGYDGIPRTENGRVAFFLWPEPAFFEQKKNRGTFGITIQTSSGRRLLAWLPAN